MVMEDTSTIDNFLWPNKYLLEIHGFWPMMPGEHSFIYLPFVYFRIVFSISNVISFIVPEILKIIVFWGDLTVLTRLGCFTITDVLLLVKMFYVLARRHSFCRMYFVARKLWLTTADNMLKRQGLEKLAGWAKRFTIGFSILCFSNNITFTTVAVIVWINRRSETNESLQERILPFDLWYGPNYQRTPNYEITFGCQTIAAFYCASGVAAFDTIMMSLILHVCGHFRVIGARLRSIGNKMRDDEAYWKSDQSKVAMMASKDIDRVIEYHCRLLIIAEEMRALLSPIVFVQLLSSGLTICLSGYAVIAGSGNYSAILNATCFLLTVFAQLVVWCWPGQLLIEDSTAVGDIICYELPWHLLTPGQQRNVAFLIMRTQKQCQITALGFQVMSMSKFTEVFNTAGSYFALLRTVYEKEMEKQ